MSFKKNCRGNAIVEYPIIAGVIALTALAGISFFGDKVSNLFAETDLAAAKNHPPIITTEFLPQGLRSRAYSVTLTATDPDEDPLTWSLVSGSLPSGITFNPATAQISGMPSEDGNWPIMVKVEDAKGATATAHLSVNIRATNQTPVLASVPTFFIDALDPRFPLTFKPLTGSHILTSYASDPDGDPVTVSLPYMPSNYRLENGELKILHHSGSNEYLETHTIEACDAFNSCRTGLLALRSYKMASAQKSLVSYICNAAPVKTNITIQDQDYLGDPSVYSLSMVCPEGVTASQIGAPIQFSQTTGMYGRTSYTIRIPVEVSSARAGTASCSFEVKDDRGRTVSNIIELQYSQPLMSPCPSF